jgi:hypothetical protein
MFFLPRAPEKSEAGGEEDGKIRFKVDQFESKLHELSVPSASKLEEYQELIKAVGQCIPETENIYLATEWTAKRHCLVLATSDIAARMECFREKKIELTSTEVPQPPFRLRNEFVSDRSEWEGIADLALECIAGADRFYVCYDYRAKTHCCIILWSTDEAVARQECASGKDLVMEAA